jgi:hypothetical protein
LAAGSSPKKEIWSVHILAAGTVLAIVDWISAPFRRAAVMRFQTYRDEQRSRHFDLVGDHWSIDLVTVTAAGILLVGFICAIAAILAH